ncbi:DNA/pantothenate metabolism flavoprotein [Emericellopsis atlantica]|uniref:DNA/pantothenate metabolism flavoprotein n=1 Tax=Emericellopsis atlantica TaxID=2614577 RepID=A0A9P7ZVJ1_9HYPO|nr:DNA/pantothenate metabolism flavoprotein [Emericellopsis atlantica]KAG9258652.1 DNA/pantothenate metabolism flavoprotein [Emericellopsis atlantica]
MSAPVDEDAYFSTQPPPASLPAQIAASTDFVNRHAAAGRRVVLITSGGTTVPLEKQTVRFIDNFSAGTRGATSAEYFLEAGYAVIFLHREFSLVPYARHFSHSTTGSFLDFLEEDGHGNVRSKDARMGDVLQRYTRARTEGTLLTISFVTITDYLHSLRAISRLMAPLGPRGLLYLAAAVSDFFVPESRMAEHKIQSTDVAMPADEEEFDNFDNAPRIARSKRLVIDLDPVPKFLKNLVDGWAPEGMITSYKLETDPSLLVHKARHSLGRYQHHLVIGNLLATRKWEVCFVSPGREDQWLRVGKKDGSTWTEEQVRALQAGRVPKEEPSGEIESLIIPAVRDLHDEHIKTSEARSHQ